MLPLHYSAILKICTVKQSVGVTAAEMTNTVIALLSHKLCFVSSAKIAEQKKQTNKEITP